MTAALPFYIRFLKDELERRSGRNASFSLRAFAKALGVSHTYLSRILSGQRPLTPRVARQLADRLAMSANEAQPFVQSAADEQRRRKLESVLPKSADGQPIVIDEISLDEFQAIAELYNFAIMELTEVEGFDSDPRWIAQTLKLSRGEVVAAIDRLLRLGWLKRENGRLVKAKKHTRTADKTLTSKAHKLHQEQVRRAAIKSIYLDPIERRSISSMTMPIDPDKVPMAKIMIDQFTEQLREFLQSDGYKHVYQMSVSLFPLQAFPDDATAVMKNS